MNVSKNLTQSDPQDGEIVKIRNVLPSLRLSLSEGRGYEMRIGRSQSVGQSMCC
jgi:hypothetical protein